jgi:hypothetical protein
MSKKRPRGRPRTGAAARIGVRIHEPVLARIEAWRRRQPDKPNLSTAVRRLIDAGLRPG